MRRVRISHDALSTPPPLRSGLPVLALLLALGAPACGSGGGGGGESAAQQEKAAERAAVAYVVESSTDEDDSETAGALEVTDVKVSGDDAEAKVTSKATGNRYEVTLAESGGEWEGRTVLTDRPTAEEPSSGGSPASGPGRKVSTATVESTIEKKLLKPLGIKGGVSCPPKVAIRRGNNFDCKLTGPRKGTVAVTQKDDEGNLNFKVELNAG